MTIHKFAENIIKTGFILENRIVSFLRLEGWTVINNKYYVDDNESSIREMDILCYKVAKVADLDIYTTLIISCKKSEKDIWALISRDIDLKNPNYDWWPLHAWSNNKAICYELSLSGAAKKYHEDIFKNGLVDVLAVPDYEVFAFQEMNNESGKANNDSNIFSSIKSLIKAQAYEIGALPQRKKSPSVYQFSLVSVIDSDMYRLKIDKEEKISEIKIDSEQYLSRYIFNKRESFSRIRFITARAFVNKLKEYTKLHKANLIWFKEILDKFYFDILEDADKRDVLIEEFRRKIPWSFFYAIEKSYGVKLEASDISLGWNKSDKYAYIYLSSMSINDEIISLMNKNQELIDKIIKPLADIYHYHNKIEFIDDIPF